MANIGKKLADLRSEYASGTLLEQEVSKNPLEQFENWFSQALKAEVLEPNAFTLATVGADMQPSARIVLLKGISLGGFTFFTNYLSRKAKELNLNPKAGMVFLWPELERQVRVEGIVSKVSAEESDDYFNNRPLGSRLGAWASHQSSVIPHREYLQVKMEELQAEYHGKEIKRPDFWGGFRLIPHKIEFWQGRPSRLHDRIRYTRETDGSVWKIDRLSP